MYSSSGLVQYRSSFLQCTLDESLFPVGDTLSVVCVSLQHLFTSVYISEHMDAINADSCIMSNEGVKQRRGAIPFFLIYVLNHMVRFRAHACAL